MSASTSGIRKGATEGRDKLFHVRDEGNASVGHAVVTVLCLVCLFYGGSFRNGYIAQTRRRIVRTRQLTLIDLRWKRPQTACVACDWESGQRLRWWCW